MTMYTKALVKSGAILVELAFDLLGGVIITCQNQYKPSCVGTQTVGTLNADDPEDVVERLNKSRDNYHPTVCLFVEYSLREMCGSGESEQDCEENCSWSRRAKFPFGVH